MAKRPPPTRTEIRQAAEKLSADDQTFLDCRDLRHPWEVVGSPFYVGSEIHRRLACQRCGTTAVDRWSAKGVRIARQYNYAKGYTMKGVKVRPVDVRKEVLNRVTVFATEDDMLSWMVSGRRRRSA